MHAATTEWLARVPKKFFLQFPIGLLGFCQIFTVTVDLNAASFPDETLQMRRVRSAELDRSESDAGIWTFSALDQRTSVKEETPTAFLAQIFSQLRTAGFIDSTRGKRGGDTLARPAQNIPFGEVIRLPDGPPTPIRCVSQIADAPCTCPDEARCDADVDAQRAQRHLT